MGVVFSWAKRWGPGLMGSWQGLRESEKAGQIGLVSTGSTESEEDGQGTPSFAQQGFLEYIYVLRLWP